MSVEDELGELVVALDGVRERLEYWDHPTDAPWPARTAPPTVPVSGASPDAAEERAIRSAAASLARSRAAAVRGELADIRDRARRMAQQARASREALRTTTVPAVELGRVTIALRAAATQLAAAEDAEQAMLRIVAGALQVITCARWGGVCVQGRTRGGRSEVSVHAASAPLVDRLEALQARENAGPCVEALIDRTTVYAPDLLLERRWPGFRDVACELGVRSVLAIGLPVSPPGGVLNLYSPDPDAFDEQARAVAEVFADHAALALAGARRTGGLTRAVESRDLIGQAKGMVMLQRGVDAERAFQILVEASQHSNLKLVDVARWTIENASGW